MEKGEVNADGWISLHGLDSMSQEITGSSKFYFSIFSVPGSYTGFNTSLQQYELKVNTLGL